MIRKLFIHIGAHKTASTSIQKWCTENPVALQEFGLFYPQFGHVLFGHHGLADRFANPRELAESKLVFREEVERASGDVIISSENFEYLDVSQLTAMRAFFSEFDISVIYFYRNWTPLLYSMWQEDVKHGKFTYFHEFCLQHFAFPYSSNVLNFGAVVQRFCDAFGRDRVRVANYETIIAKTDILNFFFALIGVTLEFAVESETVNKSFDPFMVEAIRALNHMTTLGGGCPGSRVKHNFINQSLRGDGGKRFVRLRGIMDRHKVDLHDFSGAAVSRNFFAEFLRKYADLMCDDPDERAKHVNAPSKPGFAIRSDYLLDPAALSLLTSFVPDL